MRPALYVAAMVATTIVGTASRAHAGGVLTTGPLQRSQVPFVCRIANVGTDELAVLIETVDFGGNVASATTINGIPPGASRFSGVEADTATTQLYCRFTLLKGSKSKVRALACVHSGTTTLSPCLATDVAR